MKKLHQYQTKIVWAGNLGVGTKNYTAYSRNHQVIVKNKAIIDASADIAFRGDADKYNPEELFLASLSGCHMLWYLHLCADNGITVIKYSDEAIAIMEEDGTGGAFKEAILYPQVTITNNAQIEKANALHSEANKYCFIANSCNFPVKHSPM